ncbi:MAG: hypothetical protein JWM37_504 [Candidatus Saccharibacteria bacterium]|nr:hypothetical protein [Candidatus Saccharibacteria bacterium]
MSKSIKRAADYMTIQWEATFLKARITLQPQHEKLTKSSELSNHWLTFRHFILMKGYTCTCLAFLNA